ncbi:hypothetical protein L202_06170 [Cryptococcus amylolentus CBS 6039]|uniref:Uncharacterized protein n=1 Tax=Cryptococcus amylolentus CBS 6039 TaxID=1295533 RepID=A0A1E3HKH7_9TREE|nr:hypothetical protein L202_06170 [Cryptococcus amylolentus CBS 6039]ODN76246.1 hypothetical protein L202_06170 [Cryptococcus amylolentus CBS 6039]
MHFPLIIIYVSLSAAVRSPSPMRRGTRPILTLLVPLPAQAPSLPGILCSVSAARRSLCRSAMGTLTVSGSKVIDGPRTGPARRSRARPQVGLCMINMRPGPGIALGQEKILANGCGPVVEMQ